MSLEQPISPESMEKEAKIILHFMRHGEKGKGEDDYDVRLTSKGRMDAKEKAGEINLDQAVAFGSPRKRAQESAALVMAGGSDEITGEETLEELREKLDAGRDFGTKVTSDKRLDFTIDDKTPLGAKAMEAYMAKKYMPFVVNDSDRLAEELGDKDISTYSRMAGAIAEIVKKYIGVGDRWYELVNDEQKHYEETMERFLGSHGGVTESFLLKVIEKIKGVAERDRFVSIIGNQFDFLEGFDVEVVKRTKDEDPVVRIKYTKKGKDGWNFL
jgi:broad specificity phosphatase PhoE